MWSHDARLVVAAPVSDSLLAGELRRLGTSYGVQIQTFNLPPNRLNELPPASAILKCSDDQFEQIRGDLVPFPLSPGAPRPALDWEHIRDMMTQSETFSDIFEWIARCLRDTKAYTFQNYVHLRKIEQEPG